MILEEQGLNEEEIALLLNDLLEQYGYDFTEYSKASIKRRILRLYTLGKFPSFAEFRYHVKSNPLYFQYFVEQLTVNVTEMFRDTTFYKFLRETILPRLGTYPFIRVWIAGCSTGEEVYSVAILLKEANLLHKSLIYATDLNSRVLEMARSGIFPLVHMKQYSENYIQTGAKDDFSSYYTAKYDRAIFDKSLGSKMIFSTHNLVSDRSFNEFQLILCRNVLIYFNKDLQTKVIQLFDDSLENLGYLALGSKETLRFSPIANRFKQVDTKEKIWRKIS